MSSEYQPEACRKPGIRVPISARVRGKDSAGGAFDLETTLDNLSAGGLYLGMTAP